MIRLHAVVKRFDTMVAVDHVDLDVAAGEFLTLLGPSGCGKTTLLRLVSGFETPDEGEISIEGVDCSRTPPYLRPVNQVFQSYALFPHMTVGENVAFGLKMQKTPRAEIDTRVEAALALVALDGLERRMPSALSGGQRQRVALARAIVVRPKVLLLDEPLSALDARLRRTMQLELKHLQRRLGITFVFVTHDQDEALTMSDRVAVVHRGKIAQIGSAEEIYHRPRTRFVASFVGDANLLEVERIDAQSVRLADGSLLETAEPMSEARGFVCVRPEDVRLVIDDPARAEPSILTGVVDEFVFRGPTAHVRVRTPGGLSLTALAAGHADAMHLQPGRTVGLAIAADRVHPVIDDGTSEA